MDCYLAFDAGATKTAWATFSPEAKLLEKGRYSTPIDQKAFLDKVAELARMYHPLAIGIGIAGTVRADRTGTLICTNMPGLSNMEVSQKLLKTSGCPVIVDNDARAALIGEVTDGSAQDFSSAVLLTVGTGVGGAVMQKRRILPHPTDVAREVGRLIVDPSDVFPARSGAGTIEAFIGGCNLEERFSIDLATLAKDVRKGDAEAIEIWELISEYFLRCLQAVYLEYSCKNIIIGGVGAQDLQYYLQGTPPCPVIPAKLGEEAGLYGAARLAMDAYQEEVSDWE